MASFEMLGSGASRVSSSEISGGGGVLYSLQATMPDIPKKVRGTVVKMMGMRAEFIVWMLWVR